MAVFDNEGHGLVGIHTQEDAKAYIRANKPLGHLSEKTSGPVNPPEPGDYIDDGTQESVDPGGEAVDGGSQESWPKFPSPRCKKSET